MDGAQPAGPAEVLSTSAVTSARAFEYWRDLICDTFVQLSAAPTTPGPFAGRLVHADVGYFEMTTVHAGGQRVRRTPQLIARAGEEYLLASIQTRGRGRVEQDGCVAELGPGEMALYDSTRPYTLHFDDTFEQVVVQVPLRGMLAEAGLRDARGLTAVKLGVDSPAGIVAQFFRGLARLREVDPFGAAALATQGRGLMASALALSAGRAPRTEVLTRQRIQAFLRAQHTDPDLTVDDVARAFSISSGRSTGCSTAPWVGWVRCCGASGWSTRSRCCGRIACVRWSPSRARAGSPGSASSTGCSGRRPD